MSDLVIGLYPVIALVACAAAVFVLVRRARRRGVAGPLPISPRFRDAIARLGDPTTADAAAEELRQAGPDAVPDLIAALSDEARAWHDRVWLYTLGGALDVLGRIGDPRALPVAARHVLRETHLAPSAAAACVLLGTDDAADVAVHALERGSPGVRAAAAEAVVEVAGTDRPTPEFRRRVAQAVAANVGTGVGAAAALLALDRDAACVVLTSDAVLAGGRDPVTTAEVFGALVQARAPIDGGAVLPILDAYAASPTPEVHAETLTALAWALALSGHDAARERLGALRASTSPTVRRAGVAGLLALVGISPDEDLLDDLGATPEVAPTPVRRSAWYALTFLRANGVAAFLRTAAGRDPAAAAGALRAIGVPEAAEIVEAAASRFRGGVPRDDAERARRLDATEDGSNPFLDLDERAFECADAVRDGILALVLDHADEFRRANA